MPLGRASDQSLSRDDRLRKRAEYREAQRSRHRVHTRSFLIVLCPRDDRRTRLGITVTKKVGHAVHRNRIKRCVREAFRRNRDLFPAGFDVVFIAKQGARIEGTAQIVAELEAAAPAIRKRAQEARLGLDEPSRG
ncbi:MAG: ribonuclease P protein component [Myxococcales bacterium]|nr:ribonuclease P protein component [Myxococcales bacterium]